jgi:pantetheine-phosphate adenylyltransferase
MKIAVFPGSFDPVTLGHMDLIQRARGMFDRLVLGVLVNSSKTPLFSLEQRTLMLQELTEHMSDVTVCSYEGLLADFVEQQGACAIVRGLRSSGDFEYELPLAQANHKLNSCADTVFLATAPEYSYVSSSAVRELLRYKADISSYVPEIVLRNIETIVNEQQRTF